MRRWMGCCSVSVRHLPGNNDAPWLGIPRRGLDSGRGAASNAANASARVGTQRDQPPRPRCPATGAVNSNSPDRCPADPGGQPEPLDGARQPEELRQTPTAGLDRGRRAASNPPGPVRAACGELRQIRSGSIPSWGLSGERIIPTVNPGNRDSCPQDFYGRKPRKSQTTQPLSQAPGREKTPCSTPPAIFPKLLTRTATASPATYASAPRLGTSSPTAAASAF